MMKKKTIENLTILMFLSLIGILSVWNILQKDRTFSENENRYLAQAPSLDFNHIFSGNFDDDFETWFTDQFVGRDTWISTKAFFKKITGSIENNDVYYGKNDYLIRRFQSYPERTFTQNIGVLQAFTEETGIKMNILLVPTICNANPSLLPKGSWNIDQENLIKRVMNELPEHNHILVGDSLRKQQDVYFKTDHHWNEKGAYIAYEEIAKNVLKKEPNPFKYELASASFYGTMYSRSGAFWSKPDSIYTILPEKEYPLTITYEKELQANSIYVPERLEEKDKYTYYLDGNHPYIHISCLNNTGKHAVVIKDSYAHILMPYLISEYEEIDMVDLRYYHNSVSELINDDTDVYLIYSIDNFTQDPNVIFLE